MPMTTAEQAIFDYLQQAYPGGLRGLAQNADSVIYKYDEVRAVVLSLFNENIKQGLRETVVQTASAVGLAEWETYLGITVNENLSLNARRAAILGKLVGTNPTISTIKAILDTLVGGAADTYSIKELYLTDVSPAHDDTWTYEVHIYAPVGNNYQASDLIKILEDIQPAHCQVVVVLIPPLSDQFTFNDSLDTRSIIPFDWADEGAGVGPDDGEFTDHDPFFQDGFIWSDDGTTYPIVP